MVNEIMEKKKKNDLVWPRYMPTYVAVVVTMINHKSITYIISVIGQSANDMVLLKFKLNEKWRWNWIKNSCMHEHGIYTV